MKAAAITYLPHHCQLTIPRWDEVGASVGGAQTSTDEGRDGCNSILIIKLLALSQTQILVNYLNKAI